VPNNDIYIYIYIYIITIIIVIISVQVERRTPMRVQGSVFGLSLSPLPIERDLAVRVRRS
jgi:hypothetical protein